MMMAAMARDRPVQCSIEAMARTASEPGFIIIKYLLIVIRYLLSVIKAPSAAPYVIIMITLTTNIAIIIMITINMSSFAISVSDFAISISYFAIDIS